MNNPPESEPLASASVSRQTSELNNLLHIISTTSALMEQGASPEDTEKYLAALRTSIDRAEEVAGFLSVGAGGAKEKTALRPDLTGSPKPPADPGEGRKQMILLVDDEQMTLTLGKRVLSDGGFEVTTAQSGFECLDAFRRKPNAFDLVLLDLTMPFMDGEETFHRLREIRREVPVVLCTGFIQQDRLDRLMKLGLSGFMRKPIGSEETVSFVKSTLASVRYSACTPPTGVPMGM
ncbi:MAG TPA: response regulator [Chthoniobacterales bacterium]|jgi:CheY-like chemotaxis protein